jgi:RNA polymerase sigma factor (sigma-70 family)
MNKGGLRGVLRSIRRVVTPPDAGGLTDADLLQSWVINRDEAAFESLLWRHFPAVLGVCRRVLRDTHEAEDAAQAAFLTLARKAGSIGRHQAVAAWLFTVAYRVALQSRNRQQRKSFSELADLDALPARSGDDPAWNEIRPILDEEVHRLPRKYREAFVLCHVEGRTNKEAAREIGCPMGTIHSRLAHARQRLRERLAKRGVTLTAGTLISALAVEGSEVAAGVLVRATVRAAALSAAGKGLACAVSAEVAALTEGVIQAMLLTKVKVGMALVLGTALLFGGGTALTYRTVASEQGQVAKEADTKGPVAGIGVISGEEEKFKAILAAKEKEIRELKERLATLEAALQKYASKPTGEAKEDQGGNPGMRPAGGGGKGGMPPGQPPGGGGKGMGPGQPGGKGFSGPGFGQLPGMGGAGGSKGSGSMAGQPGTTIEPPAKKHTTAEIEQARDEVELLEARVGTKKAMVRGAATDKDIEIRVAELREAEVLLKQANRRLQKLTGPEKAATGQPDDPRGQQIQEVEKKLDALNQGIEALRQQLKSMTPARQQLKGLAPGGR